MHHIYEADPSRPYKDTTPLFELGIFDDLTFKYKYAGDDIYFFQSYYAPFATLAGQNTVTVNVFLKGRPGVSHGFTTGWLASQYNDIIITENGSVEADIGVELNGSNNTVVNNGTIFG